MARYSLLRKTAPVSFPERFYMKKLYLIISLAVLLLIGNSAFGAVTYERSPSGTEITSPVSFSVTLDDIFDLEFDEEIGVGYWAIVAGGEEAEYWSEAIASTTLSTTFLISVPTGEAITNILSCACPPEFDFNACSENLGDNCSNTGISLESGEPAFTIIYSFIPISSDFVVSTLAYINQGIGGLGPFLYVIIGLPLAFWVIKKILDITNFDKYHKGDWDKYHYGMRSAGKRKDK